jgi:hypothetical protein
MTGFKMPARDKFRQFLQETDFNLVNRPVKNMIKVNARNEIIVDKNSNSKGSR